MTESISGMTNNASAYRQLSAYKPLVADKLRWKLTPTLTLNRNYSLLLYKKVRLSQLEKTLQMTSRISRMQAMSWTPIAADRTMHQLPALFGQNNYFSSVVRKSHECAWMQPTITRDLATDRVWCSERWIACAARILRDQSDLRPRRHNLFAGRQEGHPACKNWVVGCWCGYLSGARCRLAYVPADATAIHCLLPQ